ncbi:MAG: hypothetical protein R3F49_05670 [Planctomycetota bacterium]
MRILLPLLALLAIGALASAQIERLTLQQMVEKTDGAVRGEIIGREVHRVAHPHPEAGPLYFTSLLVQGKSLVDGTAQTVTVSYPGGFIDGEQGVWNSEAPTDAETAVGKDVVVFYKWSADMGGGFASNALYASHGGLFTVFEARRGGSIVQGRGDGYAVAKNQRIADLASEVARIAREKKQREGEGK